MKIVTLTPLYKILALNITWLLYIYSLTSLLCQLWDLAENGIMVARVGKHIWGRGFLYIKHCNIYVIHCDVTFTDYWTYITVVVWRLLQEVLGIV